MGNRLSYLNKLNDTLHQIEKEIIAEAKACIVLAEKRLQAQNTFTTDYEVEAEVAFYTEKGDDPIHIFKQNFKHDDLIIKKDYGLLLTKNFDWREGSMPVLSKPYCFILHDLIDHSRIGKKLLDKINPIPICTIWVDIIYTNQKAISIDEEGNTKQLKWNKERRLFQ